MQFVAYIILTWSVFIVSASHTELNNVSSDKHCWPNSQYCPRLPTHWSTFNGHDPVPGIVKQQKLFQEVSYSAGDECRTDQ